MRQNAGMMYGVLTLKIIAGRNLPNTDVSFFRRNDKTDAYVTVDTYFEGKETARLAKTKAIDDDLDPVWNETFHISLVHAVDDFCFRVKDKDQLRNQAIAEVTIRAEDIKRPGGVTGWHRLRRVGGSGPAGELHIEATFESVQDETGSNEVPRTYFPLRTGCRVKLYQDAHTPAVPPVTDVTATDGSGPYDPPCLWEDTLVAIENAKKFIYIVGWAVWDELLLKRGGTGGSPGYDEPLRDILVRKVKEGVRVCIMAWEEKFSSDVRPCGLMGTHDHTMRNWFNANNTGVHVFLSPRQKKKAEKMLEGTWVETTYTHHQKCVILDAPTGDDEVNRRLVAFVGGIDLTDGRWDTPAHELYKTLPDEHSKDFYNGVAPTTSLAYGPRQPWHDIHMYVEGGPAYDLAKNFHERWMNQNTRWYKCLYEGIQTGEFGSANDAAAGVDEEGDSSTVWNAQLFRSINMDSADFDINAISEGRLTHRKGRVFDDSIQRAYIHHIRRAKRFIYIENQYFLGSCFSWKIPETTKCPHLVPMELVARIERAIENGENFRVYITVPLHPEGDPAAVATQEVLRWQYRTLEMMYRRIGKAIERRDLDAHPRDYLSVYCLTKRDGPEDVPEGLTGPPANSIAAKCRASLRFMIYVHSKFAIFDDEYVIVGSANINERSMSGNRDTELAMGAYQPAHTKETAGEGEEICGEVRTFRLALWAEHCGRHMEEHLRPTSKECMDAMNALAEENLDKFIGDEVARNDSHLTLYPLRVDKDGDVDELDKCKTFPDLGGQVKGKNSSFLPNSVTT